MPRVAVDVVMDDASYLAGSSRVTTATKGMGDTLVSTDAKIATSSEDLAAITKKSADAQVAAILKVREASKLRISSLQATIAAGKGSPAGSLQAEQASAATVALEREQAKLARSYGITTAATTRFGGESKKAGKDLNEIDRGGLAGSGALSKMGRSLAFASSGFIAFAVGSQLIAKSITSAEDLAKAQASLSVAIKHTGGNVQKLTPIYDETAKAAAKFGVTQTDATTGLARATVLTGSAVKAQRAYQEALLISKATGKDFNTVLVATSKGQEGITTSLRRYGILVSKNTDAQKQYNLVLARFGGQAAANTTASEKLSASFSNLLTTIGTALLPTFDRLTTRLTDWLTKMQKSGRLQRDVNSIVGDAGVVFHDLEKAIKVVDDVTGSFKNTLELLLAIKFASVITGWIGSLNVLASKWGLVAKAARGATAAETVAAGGAGAAAGGAGAAARGAGAEGSVAARVGLYTAAGATAAANAKFLSGIPTGLRALPVATFGGIKDTISTTSKVVNGWMFYSFDGGKHWARGQYVGFSAVVTPQLKNFAQTGNLLPSIFQVPGFGLGKGKTGGQAGAAGPFGSARPIAVFKSFQDTIGNQLAQARAALTKSTADDVAAAKAEIAQIKREIAAGHLQGPSLIQALQAQASAVSTIQSAEAAAVQKQTARIQAQIDPLRLEVSLSRAQALGQSTLPALRALRAAAQRVIDSGKATLAEQKQAYDQITSLNQAIKSAMQTSIKAFTEPLKLQIALAREQAFGQSTTATLQAMKKAALKALHSGKYTGQALIDLYNEIASLNQQLSSSATTGLGKFKQLNLDKTTAGLGLTPAEKKLLQARLSQVGPGGTVPGDGTGAFGVVIGKDGKVKGAKVPHTGPRDTRPVSDATIGRLITHLDRIAKRPIHVTVDLDGRVIASSTTNYQHRHKRRNSSQRRGPTAGSGG